MPSPIEGRRNALAMSTAVAAALLSLSVAHDGLAQTATPLPPVNVDVAGQDSGLLSTTIVDEKDIAAKRTSSPDAAKLLKDIPGVSLYTGGGISALPSIHGMADDRIKILVNGVPATNACPNHMNPALSYITPETVSRLKVAAGITPVSEGGDSIGGTITLDKADPTFAAPGEGIHTQGMLSTAYRSNSHGISTSGEVAAATENVSLGYTGSWSRAGNYHRGGDGAPVLASRYQTENHAFTLGARTDDHLVVLDAGWQNTPYEGFPNQRMDLTQNTSEFVNGRYAGEFNWGSLDARAFWRNTEHQMNFLDYVKGSEMPMNTKSTDRGYSLKLEHPWSAADTLRVGNELHLSTLEDWWPAVTGSMMMGPQEFFNIHDGQRDRIGTFAEWEKNWNPQWTSLFGIRNDTVKMDTGLVQSYAAGNTDATNFNSKDHEKTDVNFDLTALARYEHSKSDTYEFGYARKTRSPSFYERYAWPISTGASMNNWVGDGNSYVGSIELNPEVANTISATVDWHDQARKVWGLKFTPYYTYVHDYIDAYRRSSNATTNGFVTLQLANYDAQLYGADISGELEAWDVAGWGRGVFKVVGGWVNGQNLSTGDNLYNIMPLHGKLSLEHRLGGWSNAVELEGATSKTAISNVRNEIQTPGYALVNLRTGYEWPNLSLNLGIENLFDHLYHQPLGGADLSDSNKTWGYNVFGEGRSYVAGMTVKF